MGVLWQDEDLVGAAKVKDGLAQDFLVKTYEPRYIFLLDREVFSGILFLGDLSYKRLHHASYLYSNEF